MTDSNIQPRIARFALLVTGIAIGLAGGLGTDAAGLAGAGLITYGAGLVYRPAGFIVGGLFLLAGAWMFARKTA